MENTPNLKLFRRLSILIALLCITFSSNISASPPQIDPGGIFNLPAECIYNSFEIPLEVIDPDGDVITVSANHGAVRDSIFYVDTFGVSHWQGFIEFSYDYICGLQFTDEFIITAHDNNTEYDTLNYGSISVVGRMTTAIRTRTDIEPDAVENIPVYLDTEECFSLGGLSLSFEFDAVIFNITDIALGTQLQGKGLNFVWTEDAFGPGIDNVIFITHPESTLNEIDQNEPIFYLSVWLDPESPYIVDQEYQLNLYGAHPYYNSAALTDTLGTSLWYPEGCNNEALELKFENGFIYPRSGFSQRGDINLNGYPYEAGDYVLGANAIKDMIQYPLNIQQWHNGDLELDGRSLSIFDLFGLVEGITGIGFDPEDGLHFEFNYNPQNDTILIESASLEPGESFILPMYLINHDTLFNFQADLDIDTSILSIDSLVFTGELFMTSTIPEDNYHILSFDFESGLDPEYYDFNIPPGNYHFCDIYGSVRHDATAPNSTYITLDNESGNGIYTGCVCSFFFVPVLINSEINIVEQNENYNYLPGDINMFYGDWPPAVIGGDVTYLVNYFRGLETSRQCMLDGFFASADINGDCQVLGSDVTRLVNFFRSLNNIDYCPDYPTNWPSAEYLPAEEPGNWPGCDE